MYEKFCNISTEIFKDVVFLANYKTRKMKTEINELKKKKSLIPLEDKHLIKIAYVRVKLS